MENCLTNKIIRFKLSAIFMKKKNDENKLLVAIMLVCLHRIVYDVNGRRQRHCSDRECLSPSARLTSSHKRTFIRRRNNRPTPREIVYDFIMYYYFDSKHFT